MAFVHHACLQRWLREQSANSEKVRCRVCNYEYEGKFSNRIEKNMTSELYR